MTAHEVRQKLQYIVTGTLLQGQQDRCTTLRNLLVESFGASPTLKSEFQSRAILKKEQDKFLRSYAEQSSMWFSELPLGSQYLTRGGEVRIYLTSDGLNVIKVNDAIYYATWTEYLIASP